MFKTPPAFILQKYLIGFIGGKPYSNRRYRKKSTVLLSPAAK